MAKNDVEFSIGADNSDLRTDVQVAQDMLDNLAKKGVEDIDKLQEALDKVDASKAADGIKDDFTEATTDAGEAVKRLAGGFVEVGKGIADGIQAAKEFGGFIASWAADAKEFYDFVIKSTEEMSGLKAELEEQKKLEADIAKLAEDRWKTAMKSDDPEAIKAAATELYASLLGQGVGGGKEGEINRRQAEIDKARRLPERARTQADYGLGHAVGQAIAGLWGGNSLDREREKAQAEAKVEFEQGMARLGSAADQLRKRDLSTIENNTAEMVKAINRLNTGITD